MEFHNKLYQLRKQRGLSQEELANRLHVSRQTISKWEVGDSTPDMETLVAISALFEISLDELVMGKTPERTGENIRKTEPGSSWKERMLTDANKRRVRQGLKLAGIVLCCVILIDVLSMIIAFCFFGFPR